LDENSELDEIYVGRSEDCHLQIDDQSVSRHHFVLRKKDKSWYFEKLTKISPILIGGVEKNEKWLEDGDQIIFSSFKLIFHLTTLSFKPEIQKVEQTETPILKHIEVEPDVSTELESKSVSSTTDFSELELSSDQVSDDVQDQEPSHESQDFYEDTEASPVEEYNDSSEDAEVALIENEGETFEMTEVPEEDEGTRVFSSFVRYQLAIWGEYAPYDRFELDLPEVYIGRDPVKCQIVLSDPEVSTVHAVIKRISNEIHLQDLNSSNGTILNAERINKAILQTGDEFVIGSTSFSLEIKNDLVDNEKDRLLPVAENQEIELEQEVEEVVDQLDSDHVTFDSSVVEEKSPIKRILKDPQKRKKFLYVAVAFAIGLILYEPEPQDAPSSAEQKKVAPKVANVKPEKKLSPDLEAKRNIAYENGVSYFDQQNFPDALTQLQVVMDIDNKYKNIESYYEQTKAALKSIEEAEAKKRADEERIKAKQELEEVIKLARAAVDEHKVELAEGYISKVIEKDPENIEIQKLKLELDAWKKEQERIALEKAAKEAARKAMLDALSPGKTHYLKKEWYKAINRLEEFLRRKDNDEDLLKEASEMLGDAKNQLNSEIAPILGKARSQKEGQDLRNAYDSYQQVLKIDPTNMEALNEVDEIKLNLESRAKKIYRDAIISESLSLFNEAKEKFQEVQQISPTDSDYYKKATDKLKNYLE